MAKALKLISWNVNGLRACARSGFAKWIHKERPDVLCIQETKAHPSQVRDILSGIKGYYAYFHSAERKGYSGVATLARKEPREVTEGMGIKGFDVEGRLLITTFPTFTLYNVYFPNGGRDLGRVTFKLKFYDALLGRLNAPKRKREQLIVCGDYNTAHKEIDLAHPRANAKTSGFLPEEREWVSRYIRDGYIDIFRKFHPEAGRYTWWSYMFDARRRNIGWRIDYHLVSENVVPRCADAYHLTDVRGSDHCPVVLILR